MAGKVASKTSLAINGGLYFQVRQPGVKDADTTDQARLRVVFTVHT